MDAIRTAASGINAATRMLDASAHNLANIQTTKPIESAAFQGEQVLLADVATGGVRVGAVAPRGTPEGIPVAAPDDPRSGPSGMMRMPNIDVATEMVTMMTAQHMVSANVMTIDRAAQAYKSLLDVGERRRDLPRDPFA